MIISTIESLSNDILIELFRYFHTSDLFQLFYNFNHRFNAIIQSHSNLYLTLSKTTAIPNYSPFIRSLTIVDDLELNLNEFPNLSRLILHHPSSSFLQHLESSFLPRLEYLAIPNILFGMSSLFSQIFSPRYPQLKICHLFGFETIETIRTYAQNVCLRRLTIGLIDFHVYKLILSSCPNLYSFDLQIFQSYLKLVEIYSHRNLKRLNLVCEITDWRYNDQLLDCFLNCVPNLEYLTVSRTISRVQLVEFIPDYDWFASIVALRTVYLRYLTVCLNFESNDLICFEIRRELRRYFLNSHQNRYQIRLTIK